MSDQVGIWGGVFEGKTVVEKIKTPADGSPGMGKRYRAIIDKLKSQRLVEESKSALPRPCKERYFYKRGNEVYWRAARALSS